MSEQEGEVVYTLGRDGSWPGAAEWGTIVRVNKRRFVATIGELEPTIHRSLRAAIRDSDLGVVTDLVASITCPSLKAATLVKLLQVTAQPEHYLYINDEVWVYHNECLQRDEESQLEQEYEAALANGKRVYNVYADHGVVSSAGAIYLWQRRYWATSDFDIAERGPFDRFEEALERSGLCEFGEGCSVGCRALREDQLLPLLTVHGDYFILNGRCRVRAMVGETWVLGNPPSEKDGSG